MLIISCRTLISLRLIYFFTYNLCNRYSSLQKLMTLRLQLSLMTLMVVSQAVLTLRFLATGCT